MKLALKLLARLLLVLVLVGAGGLGWASMKSSALMARTFDMPDHDFPVPFPAQVDDGQEGDDGSPASEVDATALATAQALERGEHLVRARYGCVDCHGPDFGGGVMIEDPMVGTILGPNISRGSGSLTLDYTAADWDRIVRHGIKPDGTPAVMPSQDFQLMSDQELSDIVAYIGAQPPVDATVAPPAFGPLGKVLTATGAMQFSVDIMEWREGPHEARPPEAEVSVEFGRHLAGVCVGCHQADLAGGRIPGSPPDWATARNLTPHADGLAGWTYDQFVAALREARRPDGTELLMPMTLIQPMARNMTETELQAMWVYLQSLPPTPSPE